MNRQSLGRRGEELAEKFLKKLKYKIVERNFNTRFGELDIIAQQGAEIVFVEVRTRTSTDFMTPAESVDYLKQGRLRKTAEIWLSKNYPSDIPPARFDVVSVTFDAKGNPMIEHFPDAFV